MILGVTLLACERKPEEGKAPAAAASASTSPLSDEAQLLQLQELEAAALEASDQTCTGFAKAMAAHEKAHGAELAAIMERLRAQRDAGKTSPPMTDDEKARFQRSKKVLVSAFQKCSDDPDFFATMHAK